MNRLLTGLLAVLFLFGVAVTSPRAEEPKPAAKKPAKVKATKEEVKEQAAEPVEVKPGSLLDQMDLARSAATLIRFGRENKDPESLIVAARLLARVTPQDLSERFEKDSKLELEKGELSAKSLLDEAAELGEGKAHIEASVKAARESLSESPRGRIPGPYGVSGTMPPGFDNSALENFTGYNRVDFTSTTPGATLYLQVIDPSGNSLGEYQGPNPYIYWNGTGTYQLRFRNLSPFPVQININTN